MSLLILVFGIYYATKEGNLIKRIKYGIKSSRFNKAGPNSFG
jgi:hypothetical protein